MDDLARIYIRAHVDGRWGTYSLRELLTTERGGAIAEWFMARCLAAIGLEELAIVTEESVREMVRVVELFGHPLVRLRESPASTNAVDPQAQATDAGSRAPHPLPPDPA